MFFGKILIEHTPKDQLSATATHKALKANAIEIIIGSLLSLKWKGTDKSNFSYSWNLPDCSYHVPQ